jgi:succinoglycan biosynthesis protein ExoV
MRLIHYRTAEGNFGDDLNLWLWDDLLPGWRDAAPEISLFGVGTILGRNMVPPGRKLVVGSGAGMTCRPMSMTAHGTSGPSAARAAAIFSACRRILPYATRP